MQHYRATVPGVPPTTNSSCSDSGNLHLNYSLHDRKKSIAIVWSTLLTITCIQVEVLYFSLRYGANKTEADALEIPTAILLALSVLSILYRTWQLMWRSSKCRPSGAKWWEMDFFNICAIVGFVVVTVVLSLATAGDAAKMRQASMPQTIILYLTGGLLCLTGTMNWMGWRTPVRVSSVARGEVPRPGVFTLMEDIVAVDGGGETTFRRALAAKYEGDPRFQRLIIHLNWFWGVGTVLVGVVTTVIVYAVQDINIVFALGWSIPWVWGALGAALTILWSRRKVHSGSEKRTLSSV